MARKPVKFDVNPLLKGPSMTERARSGSPYRLIPIADIDVDPDQPRQVFDAESLAELAASIKEHGVLCPILVKATGPGAYRLISGERRLRAAKLAELESVPALVESDDGDSGNALAKQLVENLQRQDLTVMERAVAIGRLKEQQSQSIREVAKKLGVSKGLVQRSLEVLALPDDLKAAIAGGASESKVLLLQQVKSPEVRKKLLAELDNLTRSQLERVLEQIGLDSDRNEEVYRRGTEKSGDKREKLSLEDRRIVEEMQRTLGTKVHLQRNQNRAERGRLTVEFYSEEDLKEVYRRLTS